MFRDSIQANLYTNGMAVMLLVGLLLLTKRLLKRTNTGEKLFFILTLLALIFAVSNFVDYALMYHPFPGGELVALLVKTVVELAVLLTLYQWMIFVDYLFYWSEDHLVRKYRAAFLPILAAMALLFVNLFTGIVFTVDEELVYHPKPLYYIMDVLKFLYFLYSIVILVRYRRNNTDSLHLLRLTPFFVPLLAGGLVSTLTSYSALALGIAIGLTNLHFSMMNLLIYEDERTGFLKPAFLDFLIEHARKQETGICTAIRLRTDKKDRDKFARILHDELPEGCITFYLGNGNFLALAKEQAKSSVELLLEWIGSAAEEEGIACSASYERNNGKNQEEVGAFIKRAAEGASGL